MTRQALLPGIAAALALGVTAHGSPLLTNSYGQTPVLDLTISPHTISLRSIGRVLPRVSEPDPVRLHTDVPDLPRSGSSIPDAPWLISPFEQIKKLDPDDFKSIAVDFRVIISGDPPLGYREQTEFLTFHGETFRIEYEGIDTPSFTPSIPSQPSFYGSIQNRYDWTDGPGSIQPLTGLAIPSPSSVSLLVIGSLAAMRRRRR